jgi:hypothetical protein
VYHALRGLVQENLQYLDVVLSTADRRGFEVLDPCTRKLAEATKVQSDLLSTLNEQLKHVWVSVLPVCYCFLAPGVSRAPHAHHDGVQVEVQLDKTGGIQVGKLMRIDTRIEQVFAQMPPLVMRFLAQLPTPSKQPMLRLLLTSKDSSEDSEHYDIQCNSTLTLEQVLLDYLPGTFECTCQLLWDGEPFDLEAHLIQGTHAIDCTAISEVRAPHKVRPGEGGIDPCLVVTDERLHRALCRGSSSGPHWQHSHSAH